MGRVQVTLSAVALLAFGPGCAGSKLWKSAEPEHKVPEGVPTAPLSATARFDSSPVVQASAVTKFTKLTKSPATEMTLLWRNRIDYLPDPGRNGEMGPGLVGQLFLFGPNMQFADANGKLTVALYDESPRPPGQEPNKPEGWEFTKETLQKLKTPDERFGMSYALFLPWPTYRPDVTRVRIAVRYEQENGHALFVPETRITIDNSIPGAGANTAWSNQPYVPGGFQQTAASSPLGGPAPGSGFGPQGSGMRPVGGFGFPGGGPQPPVPPGGPAAPLTPPPTTGGLPYGSLAPAPAGYGAPPPGMAFPGGGGNAQGPSMPTMPAGPLTGQPGPGGLPPIVLTAPGAPSR
jgi:hypothetical protein